MHYPKKRNIHRLPHIYLDNTQYFITARTYKEFNYFHSDKKREILSECIKNAFDECNENLLAWVVLRNHYHLNCRIKNKDNLKKITKLINGKSSFLVNSLDDKRGRKVWHQYHDTILESEKDFWTRFNYIHCNPIKHDYVRSLDQLESYKFSSYNYYLKKYGKEWILSVFEEYSVIDFTKTPPD
ncbi:transposase [Patescibacteria group bacterium]|nr:transposase [Patescibacteria group bacterium]